MLVSHKHRFIFIKAKKSSGSSIESYLQYLLTDEEEPRHSSDEVQDENLIIVARDGGKARNITLRTHARLDEVFTLLPETQGYRVVTSIRNPLDVVISRFWFMLSNRPRIREFLKKAPFCLTKFSFNVWAMLHPRAKNREPLRSVLEHSELGGDVVWIRQNNLKQDLKLFLNLSGVDSSIDSKLSKLPRYKSEFRAFEDVPPHEYYWWISKKLILRNFDMETSLLASLSRNAQQK